VIRAVILDWDGTVSDSRAIIVEALRRALEEAGAPLQPEEKLASIIGLSLPQAMATLIPEGDRALHQRAGEGYKHHFRLLSQGGVPLFPGVLESVKRLAEAGYRIGVATGKSRAGLDRALHETGLGAYVAASRCSCECPSKPDPAMLYEVLAELDVAPAHAAMVGDTTYDMAMGRSAGTRLLAVTYGVHPPEMLAPYLPEMWLETPARLAEAILEMQTPSS